MSWTLGCLSMILALLVSPPAVVASDVTPPTMVLRSLSVAPNRIDTKAAEQTVTATLEATDDDSGVAAVRIVFLAPSGSHTIVSTVEGQTGDVWTVPITFAQGEEEGIWTLDFVKVWDEAGNVARISNLSLAVRHNSVAVGNGPIEDSYTRTISGFEIYRAGRWWHGQVVTDAMACRRDATVKLERKTSRGWQRIDTRFTNRTGLFIGFFGGRGEGRYRAVIERSEVGTPTLATCGRAVARTRYHR